MKLTIAVLLFMSATVALSQEESKKIASDTTLPMGWSHKIVFGLDLSQVSFTDWEQGGSNSLSYVSRLRGQSTNKQEKTLLVNSYRFAFGQSRLGGEGLRKTDDEIFAEALLIYDAGLTANPYISANLRTQFATGFAYDDTGHGTPSSAFFDPAYLTQSIGLAYKPVNEVTTRIGVAAREILTKQYTNYADDPGTPEIENTKFEGGLESVTDVTWEFLDNMLWTSRLELFAPFKTLNRIIVRSDNIIAAKVNKYIATSLSLALINDVNVNPRTQVKEQISLGIIFTIL